MKYTKQRSTSHNKSISHFSMENQQETRNIHVQVQSFNFFSNLKKKRSTSHTCNRHAITYCISLISKMIDFSFVQPFLTKSIPFNNVILYMNKIINVSFGVSLSNHNSFPRYDFHFSSQRNNPLINCILAQILS